jgi:transposase-like protein
MIWSSWWVYEKNIHCPQCGSQATIRKGVRRGQLKFFCKSCKHWFQLNRRKKSTSGLTLALEHLDGLSFRSLGHQEHCHATTVYRRVVNTLEKLPHCNDITRRYCNRFCGRLLVDGKYVSVKGYEKKIPVLYGIDYLTHDIPSYLLSKGENYQTCVRFFKALRLLEYPLTALICDDNQNIYQACQFVYPRVIIQLCTNHYKENIRKNLEVRTESIHQPFMRAVETLFQDKRSPQDLFIRAKGITRNFGGNELYLSIMADIFKRRDILFGYQKEGGIPTTTNLIECFNSHLQGRLKTIKGFENFHHANIWLNGYFLKRRTRKFTDCTGKFRGLNGKCSLQKTIKPGIDLPSFF